ncbi:MAG TPA: MarR family transcriptional regulator [Erysipelotrichaceae bacterium]|nr:MarR family transcriptional regulator [Erysipelotrichaceae bacterium]
MEHKQLKALVTQIKSNHYIDQYIKKDMVNYGVSANEYMILELLFHRGKQPIQKIGEHVYLTSGTMTYIIDQLVKKGYVMRIRCEDDQRIRYVSLSQQGKELIEQSFPLHTQAIEVLFSPFSSDELDQWIYLQKKIGVFAQDLLDKRGENE